jgi:uncharacterized RDD family membrane protein YckC
MIGRLFNSFLVVGLILCLIAIVFFPDWVIAGPPDPTIVKGSYY